ncbi:MAG TPA: 50S ribosomal protein L6 [Bacilli bacterium]|nr:MAG: 50S ribosomal protein L6 [Tenericutes bacterium ADurb.BinA124]HNZ50366.1 50S ribosomal protein L6 [Bacilli bacterium]HOH18086.1 50S ribosomal protein L6 [Bacilli bacterium]HPN60971.1 50S ribosomal protein L6 [Bacilli bacterium]HPX84064.1 50S ribosomal protein L6 [Bacilli bacterium]
MSRVGNKTIKLAHGTTVTLGANNHVEVKGPKGHIAYDFHPDMIIEVKEDSVHVSRPSDSIEHRSLHGTTRALLHNMVEGVTHEFSKTLEIQGTGFRATLKGKVLVLNAGYSHLVEMPIPEGITVVVPTPTEVTVRGVDKQVVGQFATEIYQVRKPEPYLGKGIRFKGQVVRRKEGKKAK